MLSAYNRNFFHRSNSLGFRTSPKYTRCGLPCCITLPCEPLGPPLRICSTNPVDVIWVPQESGGTCLHFSWTSQRLLFPNGYAYQLIQGSQIVASGLLSPSTSSIQFTNLTPNAPYILLLTGKCGQSSYGVQTATPAFTDPAAYLGPSYAILNVEPNLDVEGTTDLVVEYTDYYCADNFQTPIYANPPEGWGGTVIISTTSPFIFVCTEVPYNSTAAFIIEAITSNACNCVAYPDIVLLRTLTVSVPSEPTIDCSGSLDGLTWNTSDSGSNCLSFSWTSNSLFAYGYVYNLTQDATIVQSGNIPNYSTTTLQLSGLDPDTSYVFNIAGRCSQTSTSEYVSIACTTTASCEPFLPLFTQTDENPVFTASTTANYYNATITYIVPTDACISLPPVLTWVGTAPITPSSTIVPINTRTWYVTNLPANTTAYLQFIAFPVTNTNCASCCPNPGSSTALRTAVTITTPTPTNTCLNQVLQAAEIVSLNGASCLTFGWTSSTTSFFPGGYNWQLLEGETLIQSGSVLSNVNQVTILNLDPETTYVFGVQGVCSGGLLTTFRTASGETRAYSNPDLQPFAQTLSNPTFSFNPDDTATMTLTYASVLATCVVDLQLEWDQTVPPGSVITPVGTPGTNQWHVTNVPLETSSLAFKLTGTGANSTCPNGCNPAGEGDPIEIPISVATPAKPVGNSVPFLLTITNYGGPPSRMTNVGKIQAATDTDPILQGAGLADSAGSWLNQQSLNITYATNIVQRFIKYHLQRQVTIGTDSFFLPITSLYFGNAIDPSVQGASVIQGVPGNYKVFLPYNYADSSSTINTPETSFQYPPFLEYFKQLMIYNWEAQNGIYTNTRQVQLALNNYGSKKANEQWWFNCQIESSGAITTTAPFNPKIVVSIVDGTANDGNFDTGNELAGWNCMERWFMHAAYCNQQLRKIIDAGGIQGAVATAMTITDVTDANVIYYQISAITTDGEGNGFSNTLYPNIPVPTWYSSVTPAECNLTIKTLWNKWFNQTLTLPTPQPTWWFNNPGTNLVAPAGRVFMGGASFTIPCSFSMTTPGLIKNMTQDDVGNPDYDAVYGIFNEIYDTSDSTPYYFVGADSRPMNNCDGTSAKVAGAPFTAAVEAAANPTVPTDTYAKNPEAYAALFGTWDNLVLPGNVCTSALEITGGNTLAPNPALTGSLSAYNNSNIAVNGLMNTSQFTPYADASNPYSWILTKGGDVDYMGLGWALEGSRYDLFNGLWAKDVSSNPGDINYSEVKQGVASADGAEIWTDLSTGLKPRVASIMKNLSTPASARGQIWMLSNQCGPWVNLKGVRLQAPPNPTQADWLTFTCPDSALHGEAWPGWLGMAGQWWGPGTSATAGELQRWSFDQESLGPYDPQNQLPGNPVATTSSTEDNFGVFADFDIQIAAWLQMAKDLQGQGLNPNGVSDAAGVKYTPATTGPPQCGCYELGFMPLSWFGPSTP